MKDSVTVLSEREAIELIDALPAAIDAETYNRLSACIVRVNDTQALQELDPFGQLYRERVEQLYSRLSGRSVYDPFKDEKSFIGENNSIWTEASPYSFRSTKFVSEFLVSWGAIFSALDVKEGQSVLEYGPGSGQLLLMLARTGVSTYGVDIDQASLDLVRKQADVMGLPVQLEQNQFGCGFDGQKFDRIVFFEAFHHAINFEQLLVNLRDRLLPDGKLVLCGEPIVPKGNTSVPYAWGPRVDALSLLCIRRFGWMELGFEIGFFTKLMMRCGWLLRMYQASIFRAHTYVAEPFNGTLNFGENILLGDGWGDAEGSHRWTIAQTASLSLPLGTVQVDLRLANYLPDDKQVTLRAGDTRRSLVIPSGREVETSFKVHDAADLEISAPLSKPPSDTRLLGIAARSVSLGFAGA